ncbi:unnamed protein product [Parnassius mnemosyne]|uniref:Reverse transcriptase n=1 Tax=Parnassius mnemosyne TaxID=213953 RepID=A0AAV1LWL1_9NEOP
MHYDGETANSGRDIANLFATCFMLAYSVPSTAKRQVVLPPVMTSTYSIEEILFSPRQIELALKKLDPAKGAGSDGIPPVFLIHCSECLSYPLLLIFNESLRRREFPTVWKRALIVPVFKSGDDKLIKNYRAIAKVFESLLCSILSWHIKHFITARHFGFVRNHSTASNLAEFVSDISQSVDKNNQVDTIYTDFSRAFDRVDRGILLTKLAEYGFGDVLSDFLLIYQIEWQV